LLLGKGAFLDGVESLKAALEDMKPPSVPSYSKVIEVEESTSRYSREDVDPKPEEFEEEYYGCSEYAIGTWFRWIEMKRV
jgi:hypothetical protein